MPGGKCQHVIEKRDAGIDLRLAFAVDVEAQDNTGLFCGSPDLCASRFHSARFNQRGKRNTKPILGREKKAERFWLRLEPFQTGRMNAKSFREIVGWAIRIQF